MVHVRIEKQLKAKATKALAAMGLSVSDATRLLLTRVAAEQALPFEVRVPNARTVAAMKEAERGRVRSARTVSAALAGLNEDD
jgi:DNA-damage-inducible protein J